MRLIDAAMGSAWAMEEPALRQLLEIAHRENSVTPEALEAYRSATLEGAENATVRNGVAILNVNGPLFKRANMFTAMSGASSYEVLMRDFQAALDDGNVKAILLNIDSPGGEASGVAEIAAAIVAARDTKPIVAYVSDLAASAAYWIASACDTIFIGQGAALGSIGVRMSATDTSARDARSGVAKFEFVSSQSPFKVSDPKTEDGAGRLQSRVDALASVFISSVAANRGVSVARVRDSYGRGDVLIGQAAVDAGMADGFGTFEGVLASLAAKDPSVSAFDLPRSNLIAAARGFIAKGSTMPTTAELEFDRVRTAALTRLASEERAAAKAAEAQAADERAVDAAVASILDARAAALAHLSH